MSKEAIKAYQTTQWNSLHAGWVKLKRQEAMMVLPKRGLGTDYFWTNTVIGVARGALRIHDRVVVMAYCKQKAMVLLDSIKKAYEDDHPDAVVIQTNEETATYKDDGREVQLICVPAVTKACRGITADLFITASTPEFDATDVFRDMLINGLFPVLRMKNTWWVHITTDG